MTAAAAWAAVFIVAMAAAGAGAGPRGPAAEGGGTATSARRAIVADDWGYQLQGYRRGLDGVRSTRFDLVVVDYSRWGDADSEWTAAQVERARSGGPCADRFVLAYMSIGEAEDYRWYWDPAWVDGAGDPLPGVAPPWLGPTNPDWAGNYKVRYWQRAWQRIVFGVTSGESKSYLDRIIDAGFDGVYLDIVDAFEYWGPEGIGGTGERERAARDMVTFVRRLARHARAQRGQSEFLVVPQNGSAIIDPSAYPWAADPDREAERQRRRYFREIDAIGAEDTFFFGDRDENNPYDPQEDVIALLERFAAAGRPVLAIDYVTQRAKIDRFWAEAAARGWIPFTARRDLARLTAPRGHPPACGT